jgi:electron transport protein HydN
LRTESFSPFVQSDPEKCIGCRTCEIACATAHAEVKQSIAGAVQSSFIPRLFLVVMPDMASPVQCHHCEDAPCSSICQMSAISRVDGRTVVDTTRCVGCKLCLMACPFGAIEFVPQTLGTRPVYPRAASKPEDWAARQFQRANNCDLCIHRAEGPACVQTCPKEALELVNPALEKSRRNQEAALDLLLQVGDVMDL